MKKLSTLFLLGVVGLIAPRGISGRQNRAEARPGPAPAGVYDPARDPSHDLAEAVMQASWSGKRILLEVGGEWCSWCHSLDAFFASNRGLLDFRDDNFIVLKVNVSPENKNESFLSNYPKIPGYPHLFVLTPDGKLLYSQDTSELELGQSYNRDKVEAFLKKWSPPT
jgi:thioredoxin-related protein